MKRSIGIVVGIMTVGGVIYLGSRLFAQAPPPPLRPQPGVPTAPMTPMTPMTPAAQPAPVAHSHIALINLGQVIKNYTKFKNLQAEVGAEGQKIQKELDGKKALATSKQNEAADPKTPPARREQLEKEIRDLQRQGQDLADDAKNRLGKMEYDRLVQTYKEVQEAVSAYARSRNIELVMHYTDGIGTDAYLPQIFQRKLSNGACFPMYMSPGLDITQDITNMLNQRFAAVAPPAVPAPGPR